MAGLALYDYALDEGCYRVRLLLSMLGLEYQSITVGSVPDREETRYPMLSLNPLGSLPVLTDGDDTYYGTETILAYLAQKHDPAGRWLPGAPKTFGRVMQWLQFSATELAGPALARKVSLFGFPGDLERLRPAGLHAFRIMDDHMTCRRIDGDIWFAADHPTLADLTVFSTFALSRDFGIDHDEFPALRLWLRDFRKLDGFITMPGIADYH